jgi:hypothetical protein
MADSQVTSDISFLESLSKLFAISIGFLYLLGFLIVASHLSRYGVASFDLLQLQYLIAGVWALGPPVLLGGIYQVQRRFDERAVPEVPGKFNWRRFSISSLLSGIPAIIVFGLLGAVPNIRDNLSAGIGIRLFLFFIGMWNLQQLFWVSRTVQPQHESWWQNRTHAAPFTFYHYLC